jgi:hypothetical protein
MGIHRVALGVARLLSCVLILSGVIVKNLERRPRRGAAPED